LTFSAQEDSEAAQILRGLLVSVDERTNSLTLVGEPELISKATEYLTLIDLRQRQVAINVKVIDINLNALDAFGTSFSFSIGDTSFINSGGLGLINFGSRGPFVGNTSVPSTPPLTPLVNPNEGATNTPTGGLAFDVGNSFLVQLFATVQEGNSKILTDPTLIVQEGQTASVALTEQIVSRITQEITEVGDQAVITFEPELQDAGLTLAVAIDRIDDNGFVSMTVSPSLSAPTNVVDTGNGTFVTLLNSRELNSGLVRVRDGQTLVLSGIIQETDRTTVTKVPILGDIPLLGALFRSTVNDNERRELVVLLTPRILDDSDQSVWGYSYTPSAEVQEMLERSRNRQ
jgi:type IV pilus assembly protein PilQ